LSDLYETIKTLCEKKGVTPSRMCIDCGMQPSIAGDLKSGRKKGLSAKSADKLAKYFNVSVSYLLGTEEHETPTIVLSESEQELLSLFNSASPTLRQLVLSALKSESQEPTSQGVVSTDI